MHAILKIRAQPTEFYVWLREFTESEYWRHGIHFDHPRGPVHLQPVSIERNSDPSSNVLRLSIRGHQFVDLEDGSKLAVGGLDGNIYIRFKLVPLDSTRTEVTADCDVPLVEPYFHVLLSTVADRYGETAPGPSAVTEHQPSVTSWQAAMRSWANDENAKLPWELAVPLSLSDVDAACHEYLAREAGSRFPSDWSVSIFRMAERDGFGVHYDVSSGFNPPDRGSVVRMLNRHSIGTLRISRVGAEITRLQVTPATDANEADSRKLRAIVADFVDRWLASLSLLHNLTSESPSGSLASLGQPMAPDALVDTVLNHTSGISVPGGYRVPFSVARAMRRADEANSDLKHTLDSNAMQILTVPENTSSNELVARRPQDEANSAQLGKLESAILEVILEARSQYESITNFNIAGRLMDRGIYNERTGLQYSIEYICRRKKVLKESGLI